MPTCEKCKRETFKFEPCNYCGRKICNDCEKSSLRTGKVLRLVICKDCWSDMDKRSEFKNKKEPVQSQQQQAKK